MSFSHDQAGRRKEHIRQKSREIRRKAAGLVAAVETLKRDSEIMAQMSQTLQQESDRLRRQIREISRKAS